MNEWTAPDGLSGIGDVDADSLSQVLGLTPARVRQLVDEGTLTRSGRGAYPFLPNVTAYVRYLRERLPGPRKNLGGEDGEINSARERALLARSQRLMIDLRRAERARRLVPVEEAAAVFGGLVELVRTKLLALPSRAAPLVAGRDKIHVMETLTGLVEESLTDLSRTVELEPADDIDDEDPMLLGDNTDSALPDMEEGASGR